jgi:hypothetical protein
LSTTKYFTLEVGWANHLLRNNFIDVRLDAIGAGDDLLGVSVLIDVGRAD